MNNFSRFIRRFLGSEALIIILINIILYYRYKNAVPVIEKVYSGAGIVYNVSPNYDANIRGIAYMDIGLLAVFLMSVFLLVYIQRKIVKPFGSMTKLTEELAKGNLSAPIKEEKSHYFGKFLWGMDMLRDTLESNKEKELDLQRERKTLILSLSHDIKTPLSAIELYTKALAEGVYSSEEKRKEAYEGIERNVTEIKNYVSEITAASREDFINLSVDAKEVYLSQVMNMIEAYYSERFATLHTDFVLEEYRDCLVFADENRLAEIFQNIFENAIKYGDGKTVAVSFSDEEDCRLVTIHSSGGTLAVEELPHIFDSFYRGSNAGNEKGSGLGLYICNHLMKAMKGDIFANCDEQGFSATVVIRKI